MALSVQSSRVGYDLAHGIVEKWLVSFLSRKEDGTQDDLGIDFFKIMMINRQFKEMFLRLYKQNFGSCMLTLGLLDHRMHIQMKENDGEITALLFKNFDLGICCYGTFTNKWLFAFLLVNGVLLLVRNVKLNEDLLESKEDGCAFHLAENKKESLLHLIYNKEDEFGKVVKAGLQTDAIYMLQHFQVDSSGHQIRDPESGTIQRIFNLNAYGISLLLEITSLASLSNAFQQLNQPAMIGNQRYKISTSNVNLMVHTSMEDDDTSYVAVFNPDALWRSIVLYALEVCQELKFLRIFLGYCFPPGEFPKSTTANLAQLFNWFKQEVLPKLPRTAVLELTMGQKNGVKINNRLFSFLREQNFSVARNNIRTLLRLTYKADSRFTVDWYIG